MSRRLDTRLRFLTASGLALCTMLSVGSFSPIFAASNLVAEGSYDRLASAEQVFFGKPDTTNTYLKRLELLEMGIFGRVRSGSQEKRFERIADALGLKSAADAAGTDTQGKGGSVPPGAASKTDRAPLTAASTGLLNPPFASTTGSPNLTDTDSPEHLRKLSESGSAGLDNVSHSSDEKSTALNSVSAPPSTSATSAVASRADASSLSSVPEVESSARTAPAPVVDTSKTLAHAKGASVAGIAAAPVSAQTKISPESKTKKPPLTLTKEPPKLESQTAHAVSAAGEHRLERPAIASVSAAADDKNKEIEALFKKGMAEFRDKHFGDAQICFKKILVIDPRNVDAYYNLGSMAEAKREYVDALTYYRAALATKPTDKDLKSAVHAMEEELHKQRGKTAASTDHHAASLPLVKGAQANFANSGGGSSANQADRYVPEVTAGMQQAPVSEVSTTDAPTVPAQQVDDKTFSLQTAQNGLNNQFGAMNAMNAPYQGMPIYGVPPTLSGNVPSNNTLMGSPATNSNRNTFNSMLSVGAGLALRGSGLHCPICRVLGGMH